jgi:myo-inositol 2-dehydrogenase/D-chiro-inositol 1-dehydrogenase
VGIDPTVPAGENIGVVIIGTGRMGRVRAQAMRPLARVEVLYAFDIIEASVQAFARDFNCEGHVLSDESLAKALSDPRVKLAVISTTSSSHYTLISAALNAGKHVFCEKPLALTAEHTEICANLAREKNLALYCGFQRRSDNHFRHLKNSIKGQIQLVRVTSRESSGNSTMAYLLASGGLILIIHWGWEFI